MAQARHDSVVRFRNYYSHANREECSFLLQLCEEDDIKYKDIWRDHRRTLLQKKPDNKIGKHVVAISDGLLFFDFALLWLYEYATALTLAFLEKSGDKQKDARHNVMMLIAWRACTDFAAVRTLVLEGFDVQAKQVLRSASENIDALGAAALNPDFAADFVSEQDLERTKVMWFKHIAKGKARKLILAEVKQSIGLSTDEVSSVNIYRDEEELVLSAVAHPSYISGFHSFLPDYNESDNDGPVGIVQTVSRFSMRTLRFGCLRIFDHCMYDLLIFKSCEQYLSSRSLETLSKSMPRTLNFVNGGRHVAGKMYTHLGEKKSDRDIQANKVLN